MSLNKTVKVIPTLQLSIKEESKGVGGGSERRGNKENTCFLLCCSTLVKQTKAQEFHVHEVVFVETPCQIN